MAYHPFRHLGIKVLAIALATLLWLTVAGEHVVERSLRVPLEFRNIPESLEIVGDTPPSVDVRVRGSSAVLSRLQPGEIVAVLDLSTARAGSRLFHLRADEVTAPFGIDVSQVQPSTLPLELERSAHRTVPVVPAVEGTPAPGFVAGRVSSEPPTVEIAGPESRVGELAQATTETVSIAGARERVQDVVTIGVSDPAVRLARAQNATINVEIWPAPVEREIEGLTVAPRNLASGLRVRLVPSTVTVTVRGSRDALSGLDEDSLTPYLDLAGLATGRYNLRVQLDPASNFGVTKIAPPAVAVTIRK